MTKEDRNRGRQEQKLQNSQKTMNKMTVSKILPINNCFKWKWGKLSNQRQSGLMNKKQDPTMWYKKLTLALRTCIGRK